jgi:biopolymer transport protein ExbD
MSGGRKKGGMPQADEHIDLVPMIDCIFLLLLFFMLCGRLSSDMRTEQITVPPTRTAAKFDAQTGWERILVNVFGKTQENQPGTPPMNSIAMPQLHKEWRSQGIDDYTGYQKLRFELNKIYDKAEKYDDPKPTGMKLPKVIIELRADAQTEYRVVQEIQQILTDTIDPNNNMLPHNVPPNQLKCFVNLDFTTRRPDDVK